MRIKTALIITIIISATASSCLSVILGQRSYEFIVLRIKQLKAEVELTSAQGKLDSFVESTGAYLLNINSDQDLAAKYILSLEADIAAPILNKIERIKRDTGASNVQFTHKTKKVPQASANVLHFSTYLNYYDEKIGSVTLVFSEKDLQTKLKSKNFFILAKTNLSKLSIPNSNPVYYSPSALKDDSVYFSVFLTLFLLVFFSLVIALSCFALIAKRFFADKIVTLAKILRSQSKNELNYDRLTNELISTELQVTELRELRDGIAAFIKRLESADEKITLAQQRELEFQTEQIKYKLTRQLAHDIRSPLAALTTIQKSLGSKIPAHANDLILQVSTRLKTLSENLLSQTRQPGLPKERISLKQIINQVVSDKKIEYSDIAHMSIRVRVMKSVNLDLIECSTTQLLSIFSNIFNNSIEASLAAIRTPKIKIFLCQNTIKHELEVHICDNGIGIPPTVLKKLGSKEVSYGKQNGNGIALKAAKDFLDSFSSNLKIHSRYGHGTRVSISFPIISNHESDSRSDETKLS